MLRTFSHPSCVYLLLLSASLLSHALDANEVYPSFLQPWVGRIGNIGRLLQRRDSTTLHTRQVQGLNYNKNGSAFVWIPQDMHEGKTFFDGFDFFTGDDPTHGLVKYVSRDVAVKKNYTWIEDDGTARIIADMTSVLPYNAPRESIRINTKKFYTTGLFIIDLNRAPYGCAVWPAFWSTAIPRTSSLQDAWPNNGEIDVLEGVHDQQTNRMAWHAKAGCLIDKAVPFTGNVSVDAGGKELLDCESDGFTKGGCSITDWSKASYGEFFESQGGGVLAMKWDENDISVWSFFRAAIPDDIKQGIPTPASWGPPSAKLDNSKCDIPKYFSNHTVIINITFCGDWAGNTYSTTQCPGTCVERMMDPTNFVNATWSINSFKVYQKQPLNGDFKPTSSGINLRKYRISTGVLLGVTILAGAILAF